MLLSDDQHALTAGEARIYVILGSHACRTGMLMLEHKRVPYRRVTLRTGAQPRALRRRGFPGRTVPALELDGYRVQTNREISRFLDRLRPERPLFPSDPIRRRQVEDAERWGDEVFQMVARRLAFAGALHGRTGLEDRANDGRLGPLLFKSSRVRLPAMRVIGRFWFNVNRLTELRLLDELPPMLDTIDAWIDAGVLSGEELNAADYMIATSLCLLLYRPDLQPEIESRPAGALADRVIPEKAPAEEAASRLQAWLERPDRARAA